jgi:mannose-6-phosphate isomerase-like protein (cupin superfamily)
VNAAELSEPASAYSGNQYGAPHCAVHGQARGSRFQPDGYSLWRVLGDLEADTELHWGTDHGDEALFVLTGALDVNGGVITEGSTLIAEAGVPIIVRSLGSTQVVHFGPSSANLPRNELPAEAATVQHGLHVVPAKGAPTIYTGEDLSVTYFSDGTCPTCRIAFFLVDGSGLADGYTASSHLHSEDEIIHVLEGELRVGRLTVAAGSSIAIPANLRYSFRTSQPFRFLNYRADVSTILLKPGTEPLLETVSNLTGNGVARPD